MYGDLQMANIMNIIYIMNTILPLLVAFYPGT